MVVVAAAPALEPGIVAVAAVVVAGDIHVVVFVRVAQEPPLVAGSSLPL